ncbi:MAG TPA: tail fiber domain-containing protein [Candidatus Binatia bacterium]|jgi:hypothetical protein|nr:tail fiber domain-containing protein [Candidatus Binatia bacterium]
MKQIVASIIGTIAISLLLPINPVFAQGTAFTYQGRLNDGGNPANGTYDLRFAIYDSTNSPGILIAGPLTNSATAVSNGLFTVLLDFGTGVFIGPSRWLDIAVRTNGGAAFVSLSPGQPLTPAPYAIMANSASNLVGTLPATQLSGTVPLPQLPGAVLTNTESGATLGSLTLNGPLYLPSTGLSPDIFYSGTALLLYGDNNQNFFTGQSAGNSASSALLTGISNTGDGFRALYSNMNGSDNTAVGADALSFNTSGSGNSGIGSGALFANSSGSINTAYGYQAMTSNTNGFGNTADGAQALLNNANGAYNGADGYRALYNNTIGFYNTAGGAFALFNNSSASYNIALGYQAGYNLTTGSSNIDIGNPGLSTDTNIIRIGSGQAQTFIAGVLNGNGGGLTGLNVSAAQLTSIGDTNGGTGNFFLGPSGNSSMTGSYNTADGLDAFFSNTTGPGNSASGAFALSGNTTGGNNTAVSAFALESNSSGSQNSAYGASALSDNTTGNNNTAIGFRNLLANTNGANNTGIGAQALESNTSGNNNTASGLQALQSNSTGSENTASGAETLFGNTTGSFNTAGGYASLQDNTTGSYNSAAGSEALLFNTTGSYNSANGAQALFSNTTGSNNTANGYQALYSNTNGFDNTAEGAYALYSNTSGNYNTANGIAALNNNASGIGNTADGAFALNLSTTGSSNVAVGFQAGLNIHTGSSNIDIGNLGLSSDNNLIRIGSGQAQTYVAGIYGDTASGGVPVYVNSSGQLGTASDVVSVALINGSQTFTAANAFSGGVTLSSTVQVLGSVFMNDHDIQFRGDTLHGVGWYGAGKTFAGLNVNGPALYGNSGGVLGSKGGSTTNAALSWDFTGNVELDPNSANTGSLLPGLTFGAAGSEGISSKRTAGTAQFGLDFFTGGVLRLIIANSGFVGIGTNNPQQALHVVGNILATGSSDRNAKENFVPVNPRDVLDKVAALPISRWNYKHESDVTHLGPMAQDFYAAFAVGMDEKHISMVDADGVALAAIQALNEKLNQKDAELASLKQRLGRLERLLNERNGGER